MRNSPFIHRPLLRLLNLAIPILLLLGGWQALAELGIINANLLPPPTRVAAEFWQQIRTGVLIENCLGSLGRILAGFAIASLVGVVLGVMLGMHRGPGSLSLLIDLLRPIPPIAWIPIAILWFGLGNRSAIFIVSVGAFFPIFVNTYAGIRSVNQAHINAARCLGARQWLMITEILIPAASPTILTGLRIGAGIAWTSVIAAEMVGTHEGLGYAIQLNRTMLQTEAVIVGMLTIGIIGWGMNVVLAGIERYLTRWNKGTLAIPEDIHHAR